jgi:hypothetical protein
MMKVAVRSADGPPTHPVHDLPARILLRLAAGRRPPAAADIDSTELDF